MTTKTKSPINPLEQLRFDILNLQKMERKQATLVQVPLQRALDICGMNEEQWRIGSKGFLSDDEIDEILNQGNGANVSVLNRLVLGTFRILVAPDNVNDFDTLKILEGTTMEEQ
jgi:hypothetical protein